MASRLLLKHGTQYWMLCYFVVVMNSVSLLFSALFSALTDLQEKKIHNCPKVLYSYAYHKAKKFFLHLAYIFSPPH